MSGDRKRRPHRGSAGDPHSSKTQTPCFIMFDGGSAVVYSLDVRGGRPVKIVVDLDVLGVSDVSQVKVYKYSLTREAYVEVEDHVVDVKPRTAAFTLKPGDPVVAITSKPIKPRGGCC